MKTDDLLVIETKGNLLERAEQFGEAFRDNYRALLEVYGHTLSLSKAPNIKCIAEKIRTRYLQESRKRQVHMSAIAKGLGVSMDTLLDLNIYTILNKTGLNECSGFIISRNGQVVVGQNTDTTKEGCSMTSLEIGRNSEGPDTARLVSVFPQDMSSGITRYGLGVGGCSGPNDIDPLGEGNGVTGTLLGEFIFCDCRNTEDIIRLANEMPVLGRGFNAVYVDSQQKTLWMQYGGGKSGAVLPKTPYCVATGYRTCLQQPDTEKARADHSRWKRFMTLGKEAMQKNGDLVEDVKAIMADHNPSDDHPVSSPCRHGEEYGSTQYSYIFDVTNRKVYYCGQPCCNPWKEVALS